ncbi:MAG: orotate phosphoribosyltransferase [Bacteroidales bacterium]|nr:orotate phosphoribosyltransferase [Bacteroidales bacterium]
MINSKSEIAKLLLQSKAIKLEPANPFKWASGWLSPIYCDNRITLSFPDIRTRIRDLFVEIVRTEFPSAGLVAGVATGAIAQGVLVADQLNLPFVYVRSDPKDHGRRNQIEGMIGEARDVIIIEDLVSTGGSSLKAAAALHEAGCNVLGMVAVFTYGFAIAEENFRKAGVKLVTLSNYHELLKTATETGYITGEEVQMLSEWRRDPGNWGHQQSHKKDTDEN